MRIVGFLLAVLLLAAPAARAGSVGFQVITIPNGTAQPLLVGVWYPTDAPSHAQPLNVFTQDVAANAPVAGQRLPLIVFSHGTGGFFDGHLDTANALARAGFVVAAVTHTGDNYRDQSQSGMIWLRSQQIHRLIDYMLAEWPDHARVDGGRVGMFGFSAGGFTTLLIAGGVPDFGKIAAHCQQHPDYFDCNIIKKYDAKALRALVTSLPRSAFVHDPRVRAVVVAAPALGYTFGRDGLNDVTVPMQLWKADHDHILPAPEYADAVHADLPRPPEWHVVENGDHYDFLAPCPDAMRAAVKDPEICQSRPGFDRTAFHERFDAEVVRFFEETLR